MDILALLDEIQTIARNGLNFTPNPYDRERYERLLQVAATYYGRALDLPARGGAAAAGRRTRIHHPEGGSARGGLRRRGADPVGPAHR